jgi:hypothetical protein
MLTSHAAKYVLAGGLADKKDATMPPKDHRDPPRENWLGNCYEQLPTQQRRSLTRVDTAVYSNPIDSLYYGHMLIVDIHSV